MFEFPQINPVAFSIFGIRFHWYGMMYLIGALGFLALGQWRARDPKFGIEPPWVGDMMIYAVIGAILGGRSGYILFYSFDTLLYDWVGIFRVWEGGMSFHGGLLGVLGAMWLFARKHNQPWLKIMDFCAPMAPIGLGAGRFGNFINGELWGRATDVPWAVVFPHVDQLPRHPSQLYEMFFEGVLLFIILWQYSRKPRRLGAVSGWFAVLYGVFRFGIEFTREPDAHIGFIAGGWLTMGQALSLALFIVGIFLLRTSVRKPLATK